jgi:hypothetical protein
VGGPRGVSHLCGSTWVSPGGFPVVGQPWGITSRGSPLGVPWTWIPGSSALYGVPWNIGVSIVYAICRNRAV